MVPNKIVKKTIYRTIQLLEFIVEASITVPEAFVGKDVVYKGCKSIFGLSVTLKNRDKVFSRNISELKRNGYIKENSNNSIVLTNKAKLKYIEKYIKRKNQDRKFRFVSYDIPEPLRRKRDQFRSSIRKMGFVKIQKSLWVSNRDVTELLEIAIEEYGVGDYVIYLVSDSSNVDKMMEQFLNPKKTINRTKKSKTTSIKKEYMDFSEFRKKVRW